MRASAIALSRAPFAASITDPPAFARVADPIEACDLGNLVSPIRTLIFSGGSPNVSAAICRNTVYVPVPRSCEPASTKADPSLRSVTRACAGQRQ